MISTNLQTINQRTILIDLISAQNNTKPTLLMTHKIPAEVANDKSLLMHIVLEFIDEKTGHHQDGSSRDVFAYISDFSNGNIVIFDWSRGVSYKKSSYQMKQTAENFEVHNQQVISLRSGVRGLALHSHPNLKVH